MKNYQNILPGFLLAFALLFHLNALHAQGNLNCPTTVASACVGDCGSTAFAPGGGTPGASLSYTVTGHPGQHQFCLVSDGGNLCALTSAEATISVDGTVIATGIPVKNAGEGRRFHAPRGSEITVDVQLNIDPRIFCIVQGSFSYHLATL